MSKELSIRNQTFDELLLKTMAAVEPLPARIKEIEDSTHQLEINLATHNIDKDAHDINIQIKDLSNIINSINESLVPLVKEYKDKTNQKKEIKEYVKNAIISFIRYAMLPITIMIFIYIGVPAEYLPWYKPKKQEITISPESNIDDLLLFINSIGCVNNDTINYISKKYSNCIIRSYNVNENDMISTIISNRNINNKKIIIWTPINKKGYIRLYMNKGLFGRKIEIED